jgi:DNA-nicking Smr family endonuclease
VIAGGHKPTSRGRSVTAEEAELWTFATRSLEPLQSKSRIKVQAPGAPETSPLPGALGSASFEAHAAKPRPVGKRTALTTRETTSQAPQAQPPLATFDRRKARQIAAGKSGIEAKIDLHGQRLKEAHQRLVAFLQDAQAKGCKTVLVVTGKGGEQDPSDHLADVAHGMGEPRRGVLRRNVPRWLEEPGLRPIVLSYAIASPRHGGAGALYVQLRRSGRTRD